MNRMTVRHVLARIEDEIFPPSSALAKEGGCLCDRELNRDPVWYGGGTGPAWWVSVECPLHRIAHINPPENDLEHLLIESE